MNPHNKEQLYNSQVSPQLSGGGHTVNKKKRSVLALKMGPFRWVKYSAILGDLFNLVALRDLSEISRGEGGGNFIFGFGYIEVTHPCNGSEIC